MDGGVPVKLLHEAQGHPVTLELKNGELYRGVLVESDSAMNCQMRNVVFTARDGRRTRMENVFLRGTQVRLAQLPDILQSAPMFKKLAEAAKARRSGGAA